MKKYSVGIIGSGRVATHLSKALQEKDHRIAWIYSRTLKNARILGKQLKVPFTNNLSKLEDDIDFIIVSIKDDAIEGLLEKLSNKIEFKGIILHTSGSISSKVAKPYFRRYGIFYPLQTFSKESQVNFDSIPLCIEANRKKDLAKIRSMALGISNHVIRIGDKQRFILHVAAVFACNFTNHMYVIAQDILQKNKLSFDMLRPLIQETSTKVQDKLPSESQTGPAARNDRLIMEKHLDYLDNEPGWKELYRLISYEINKRNEG